MANFTAYRVIKAQAEALGWPKNFRDDLVKIDRSILAKKDAPAAFAWAIRESGTDLFIPDDYGAYAWAVTQRSVAVNRRYYWYDGKTLEEVSLDAMLDRLVASMNLARMRVETLRLRELLDAARYAWDRRRDGETQRAYLAAEEASKKAHEHIDEIEKLQTGLDPEFVAETRAQVATVATPAGA